MERLGPMEHAPPRKKESVLSLNLSQVPRGITRRFAPQRAAFQRTGWQHLARAWP